MELAETMEFLLTVMLELEPTNDDVGIQLMHVNAQVTTVLVL